MDAPKKTAFILTVCALCFSSVAFSENVGYKQIASGLSNPVAITHAGDGSGRIWGAPLFLFG